MKLGEMTNKEKVLYKKVQSNSGDGVGPARNGAVKDQASLSEEKKYPEPSGREDSGAVEDGMPEDYVSNWTSVDKSFDDMDLNDGLLRGIYGCGFTKPSYIQQRGISPILTGRDVIAQAPAGTGKTATFCIGALERLDRSDENTQVMVLSPTRPLTRQTSDVMTSLAVHMNVTIHCLVGGTSVREDIQKLRNGVQIVVGTPGRTYDMMNRGHLRTKSLKLLILDEADELMDRGFLEATYEICAFMPSDVQVCLFSATMPESFLELTRKFMRKPIKILVPRERVTVDGIKQFYVYVERDSHKLDTLCDLYECVTIDQAVIFCNKRSTVEYLEEAMTARDFSVSILHGNLDPQERREKMNDFRCGKSRVLITTNILARGIDVSSVSLVVNYDLPIDKESYVHRIGRSGRYGKKGVAINFVTENDTRKLREIERYYSTEILELQQTHLDKL